MFVLQSFRQDDNRFREDQKSLSCSYIINLQTDQNNNQKRRREITAPKKEETSDCKCAQGMQEALNRAEHRF